MNSRVSKIKVPIDPLVLNATKDILGAVESGEIAGVAHITLANFIRILPVIYDAKTDRFNMAAWKQLTGNDSAHLLVKDPAGKTVHRLPPPRLSVYTRNFSDETHATAGQIGDCFQSAMEQVGLVKNGSDPRAAVAMERKMLASQKIRINRRNGFIWADILRQYGLISGKPATESTAATPVQGGDIGDDDEVPL